MKSSPIIGLRLALLAGCATVALTPAVAAAQSQSSQAFVAFDIPAQDLDSALTRFGQQSEREIIISSALTRNRRAPAVQGNLTPEDALGLLLAESGLTYRVSSAGSIIVEANDPQGGSAAGDGADGTVEALIVTAQKREEDIQDVPIAISAFTQEDLTRQQIAGGPDLITQVPNMTFTKTNFSSYSVQLRGIGTQAISATTDPAVAVAFNNTPFIRNRFFEQEFYDLQRVEVLRGPQGTLYGRNATAGVVNIISAKPKFTTEAKLSGDLSNYNSSRIEGMINIPLVEDKVALRLAGAWTKREGYATNEITGNPIDGRDLWSTRVSLRVTPNDRLDVNLIWEHFEENDDRLRSGKQLCKKHVVTELAGLPVPENGLIIPSGGGQGGAMDGPQAAFNQGCVRVSLYSPEAFQTPQGYMLPFYMPLGAVGLPIALPAPYVSEVQSQDLRVIESTVDPDYRAKADIGELQLSLDLTDTLTLASETAYAVDEVFSLQDYNRFNTAPGAWRQPRTDPGFGQDRENALLPGPNGGIFCDPQLGCSDRLIVVDLSTAEARQFTQEFRLSSDMEGPFNFSLGANFMRADSMDKYYVFSNSFSLFTINGNFSKNDQLPPYVVGETDNLFCLAYGAKPGNPNGTEYLDGLYPVEGCHYTDPNPIGSLNDEGHNYFLSKNPYKLISYAVFGEAYYQIADNLKLTAGLRWTVDKKEAPRVPSWLLTTESFGYPVAQVIEQEWREPTGRLTVDWKPDLAFTDETMVYLSYAHGYKAGGANPPPYIRAIRGQTDIARAQVQESATKPRIFNAEFVDAFEVGTKNTLLDGQVTANLAAFYYDYTDYQISEIVDRSAFNRNFDATVWGVELEVDWRPLENLRFGFKGGYEKTRIADGERAIDLMDRTAGDPRWVLARPFPTYASSCILPAWLLVGNTGAPDNPEVVNARGGSGGFPTMCEYAYDAGLDPVTAAPYVANPDPSTTSGVHNGPINYAAWSTNPDDYPGAVWPGGVVGTAYPGWDPTLDYGNNGGEGIFKDLSGNELPNAPQWTATITADYTVPLSNEWLATLHTDLHWQAESWWRVFNDHEFSRLDEYFTMNLAAIFTNEERGWNVMAYVKNVTDETAITGAFLNSDDTGLTTNVFLTEPRLYGLRVTKAWNGVPWLDGIAQDSGPFPLTVELGGQVQRQDAPYEALTPGFQSVFPEDLNIFDQAQNQNLDRGDGRSIRVTYRPNGGSWSVAGAMRYGRTNGDTHRRHADRDTDPTCGFAGYYAAFCSKYVPPSSPFAGIFDILQNFTRTNSADSSAKDREEHEFIDFAVGKDVQLGGLHSSKFGLGVRYASLESSTLTEFAGVPNWDLAEGWTKYPSTHDRFTAEIDAEREFNGAGPMLSWDASLALLGDDDAGHAMLDWSVNGGVLFGRQKSSIVGSEHESGYSVTGLAYVGYWTPPISTEPPVPIAHERSDSKTAPFVELSAGLSYEVRRIKIGAGYRWERYFDVLDVGYDEAKDGDRTIDGPYFKLSVGFGG